MRKVVALVLVLVFLTSLWVWGFHLGGRKMGSVPPTPRGGGPITAGQYQRILGVGINVDWMTFSWVNHYYFYWRSKGVNVPAYFKRKGFSNIRIRVSGDVTENKSVLVQLGEVVNDTLKAGLIPVITYTAKELRENPTSEAAQRHFILWWLTVARYFKSYPYTLSYDLLIESSGSIRNYPMILNKIYSRVIAGIRAIDPYRIIIVTPAGGSSPFYLNKLNVTNDDYILAEWHIYAGGPKGCIYNGSYIREAVAVALNWSARTGIPTWVGAWRPNVYPRACGRDCQPFCPLKVELSFSRAIVSALNKVGIPYDINADVRFFNIENLTWYNSQKEVLELIINSPSPREELSRENPT